ncbi:glycosyltransferase [Elusimicrobiota bacterium]
MKLEKPDILHITYDYPMQFTPHKTHNIKKLCDYTSDAFNNVIIALNRTTRLMEQKAIDKNVVAMNIFSMPLSLFYKNTIWRTTKKIMHVFHEKIVSINSINLIHAHKLSYEGAIAMKLSKYYEIPYVITIRQSDIKMWECRRDLRNHYRKVLNYAKKVYVISPWMKKRVLNWFGSENHCSEKNCAGKIQILGNIVDGIKLNSVNEPLQNKNTDNKRLLSVFKLRKNYIKIKNVKKLLKAVKLANKTDKNMGLDIVGSGSAVSIVKAMVRRLGLNEIVEVKDFNSENVMSNYEGGYSAFIMPSRRETFGVAYIEALVSGLPVIYSKDTGIDGFFSEDIGIRVDSRSVEMIADAILEVLKRNGDYKANVQEFLKAGKLNIFSEKNVTGIYVNSIKGILNNA